ncbi:hypothetical protein DAPPUDRAFT_317553 [Daphnia pulex]|uniref:Uncharacterized protein n=1 Tax=Daphnia pulex TaxID=6669 RepID=E9GGA3_DAPPU|nr:hypothetical protein DAPPUDRAFT_317553 [Daphnia pulex]|eukprot:EFX81365.1 hypothetical protein DAPPUDRAFT_317553 [Daphnia pulex]
MAAEPLLPSSNTIVLRLRGTRAVRDQLSVCITACREEIMLHSSAFYKHDQRRYNSIERDERGWVID